MSLIALRIIIILAISYLFGLLVAKLASLSQNFNSGGGDSRGDDPVPTMPPDPDATSEPKSSKKWLVEVDESYYLEEFDLSHKSKKD